MPHAKAVAGEINPVKPTLSTDSGDDAEDLNTRPRLPCFHVRKRVRPSVPLCARLAADKRVPSTQYDTRTDHCPPANGGIRSIQRHSAYTPIAG